MSLNRNLGLFEERVVAPVLAGRVEVRVALSEEEILTEPGELKEEGVGT